MKIKLSWILPHVLSLAAAGLSWVEHDRFFLFVPIAIAAFLTMLVAIRIGNIRLRRISQMVAVLVPLVYLAVFILSPKLAPVISRRESIRLLTEAAKEGHPETPKKGLDLFLRYPDGNWLAIRYVDEHNGCMWSVAVALDSKGNLYESEHHFCSALSGYKYEIEHPESVERLREGDADGEADDQLKPKTAAKPPRFSGIMGRSMT